MTTLLPIDSNNNAIPALRLKDGGAQSIAVNTSSSVRNAVALTAETRIISLYTTGAVYLRFGDSSVVATSTDHYFPDGVYYDLSIGGNGTEHTPYVAALAVDTDSIVYVSEKV